MKLDLTLGILVALLRADLEHAHDDKQSDLFDPDDSIPF
jgi:hypothetical protein